VSDRSGADCSQNVLATLATNVDQPLIIIPSAD